LFWVWSYYNLAIDDLIEGFAIIPAECLLLKDGGFILYSLMSYRRGRIEISLSYFCFACYSFSTLPRKLAMTYTFGFPYLTTFFFVSYLNEKFLWFFSSLMPIFYRNSFIESIIS
jgi:hypothetical protein